VKQTDPAGKLIGKPFVAVDLVDAGEGELVLTGHGSSARQTDLTKDCPVDAVVVAVVDTLDVDGENVFRKE
jgi:microcompartment protein CcmK/EutM